MFQQWQQTKQPGAGVPAVMGRPGSDLFAVQSVVALFSVGADGALDDSAIAARALAGDPILVFPFGTHFRESWWDGEIYELNVTEKTVAEAVENFTNRANVGIRQNLIAVNENHQGRALGWYTNVVALPGGLGASFRWTRKGREALEAGEFAYFSIEFAWEILDRKTGKKVFNQVVGGALTNSPFFGQDTALASRSPNDKKGGFAMAEHLEEIQQENKTLRQILAGLFSRGGGADAPGVPPVGDGGSDNSEQFAQVEQRLDTVLAQVETLTANLETVTAENTTLRASLENAQAQLADVQQARTDEHFGRIAENFEYLPAQRADLARELQWLHAADTNGGTHYEFFADLLALADQEFGVAFHERGTARGGGGQSAEDQVLALAAEYRETHADVGVRDSVDAVLAERPDLKAAYEMEQRQQNQASRKSH